MKYFMTLLFLIPLSSGAQLKGDMQEILKSYVKILPYTQSNKSLDDGKLVIYLEQLRNHIKSSKDVLHTKSPTFKSNIKYLEDNIGYIKKGIQHKHFNYSRTQIKKLVSNCISCHSQLPHKSYKKISHKYAKSLKRSLSSNYEKGMFAYFVRDYKTSIAFLKKDLAQVEGSYNQELAIAKILKIQTMNTRNYVSAKSFIQEIKTNPTIKVSKSLLTKWETDLMHWTDINKKKYDLPQIKELIKKYLEPIESELKLGRKFDNHINLFTMQGLISNHLIDYPSSKIKAESLYWLGLLENSTPSLYSLGDMYLIDCIKSFPTSKIAKKCFNSYQESVKLGFTGSAGTSIPIEVQNDLNELEALLKSTHK